MAKFKVDLWGDVTVEAESEEEALACVLERVTSDPKNHLYWDVEQVRSCRFCGCTDDEACEGGCAWVPGADDVCNSPACLKKLKAEKAKLKAEKAEAAHA